MRLQGPHAPIFGIAYGRLCFDDGLDKMLAPEAESLLFQTWNVAWSIPPGLSVHQFLRDWYPISGRRPYRLKTLPRCFLRRNFAHRLAKPRVPCVRSEPRVPDHQEMKWTQLLRRFHQPQGGIPFHHLPHAIR